MTYDSSFTFLKDIKQFADRIFKSSCNVGLWIEVLVVVTENSKLLPCEKVFENNQHFMEPAKFV